MNPSTSFRARRRLGASLLLVLAAGLTSIPAKAQAPAWPNRPVKLVVPFPAGGGADVVGRLLAQGLSQKWGQPVVIDNKAGANTIVGADAVAKSAPDGYTLLMAMDTTLTQNQFLFSKLPYDPIGDFAPVSLAVASPVAIVASERYKGSLGDWVAQAKAAPGKLNYGVSGISTQVVAALFEEAAQTNAVHVTYKGSAPTAQGLLAGDVDVVFDGIAPYLQFIKTGKARALAVTSAQRSGALPDVQTAAELGFRGVDHKVWFGFVAPKGTPRDLVIKIRNDLADVLAQADVKQKLGGFAFDPVGSSPAEFEATIKADTAKYGPIIKRLGIKLD